MDLKHEFEKAFPYTTSFNINEAVQIAQKFAEHYHNLQLHKTQVSGSVFEKFELEYIDHLIDTDFDINHETFSNYKVDKLKNLMSKIEKLRLS